MQHLPHGHSWEEQFDQNSTDVTGLRRGREGVKHLLSMKGLHTCVIHTSALLCTVSSQGTNTTEEDDVGWHSPSRSCQQNQLAAVLYLLVGTTFGKAQSKKTTNLKICIWSTNVNLRNRIGRKWFSLIANVGLPAGVAWSKSSSGESLRQVCCSRAQWETSQ